MNIQNPNNESFESTETPRLSEEIYSSCSTPYVSAPSSPGRSSGGGGGGSNNYFFFSAPASPMHYILCSSTSSSCSVPSSAFTASSEINSALDFDFSARLSSTTSIPSGSMSSADELFLNGQIRPMKLSSHLQSPQVLAPLLNLDREEEEEEDDSREFQFVKRVDSMVRGRDLRLHNRSLHRRARSLSPLRTNPFQWQEEEEQEEDQENQELELNHAKHTEMEMEMEMDVPSIETTPSVSASSSRSSSSGRNSKRWLFLKDFLRSKSEGRGGNTKDKFWYKISSSITKENSSSSDQTVKPKRNHSPLPAKKPISKPANGVSKRRGIPPPSPHELHYTAKRAQAEEMKKKTYLPYRQGLLGCLGFSSKGYNAMNVFTRSLNPVSSR